MIGTQNKKELYLRTKFRYLRNTAVHDLTLIADFARFVGTRGFLIRYSNNNNKNNN